MPCANNSSASALWRLQNRPVHSLIAIARHFKDATRTAVSRGVRFIHTLGTAISFHSYDMIQQYSSTNMFKSIGGCLPARAPHADHICQTLTFGSYRRPRLTERAAITLAAFGTVGWKAFVMLRRTQRTWSRVGVAIVAPCLAWLLRSVMSFLYK